MHPASGRLRSRAPWSPAAALRFNAPFTGLEVIAQAGTVIGDNDGEPVATLYDDCVLVMPSTRQARAGVTVVRYARRRLL